MSTFVQTTAQSELLVGTPLVLQGAAPSGEYAAVFEDDGETGYFYALNLADSEQPIQNALHIYDVQQVQDREEPSDVRIGWSSDGSAVLLAINGHVHAVFNFSTRQAGCRTGFPPPDGQGWAPEGHAWRESLLEAFAR
jgi:hypothetical protein